MRRVYFEQHIITSLSQGSVMLLYCPPIHSPRDSYLLCLKYFPSISEMSVDTICHLENYEA